MPHLEAPTVICPICSGPSRLAWSKDEFEIFSCQQCAHEFCTAGDNPDYVANTYDDEYFNGGGGGYSNYLAHEDLLINAGRRYAALLAKHIPAGRVLDIGAAAGFVLTGFEQSGWTGVGVEPNPSMVEFSRARGQHIVEGTIEELAVDEPFDAALIIQVISHLRKPLETIQHVHQLLRPGGLLLIETWNRASWTARLLGRNWHQANPPSVLHWYTRPELDDILGKAGFRVLGHGRPLKWISIGNGVSLIRHSVRHSLLGRLATAPLALVPHSLKAPYFFDDVFWVLAEKPKQNHPTG